MHMARTIFMHVESLEHRLTPDASLLFAAAPSSFAEPRVVVYMLDNTQNYRVFTTFLAYDAKFTGGVNVATADVNGDGTDDVITGAGPGGGPHVIVFDGYQLLQGRL